MSSSNSGTDHQVPRKSNDEVGVDDIEMGEVNKENEEDMSEKFMSEFFEEVNAIKTGMAIIGKNIEKVDKMSKDAIVAVKLDPGTSNYSHECNLPQKAVKSWKD